VRGGQKGREKEKEDRNKKMEKRALDKTYHFE